MGLVCARLSCEETAAASMQFDADGARVLIIDLTEAVAGIPMCGAHARTRTAPIGWTLEDLRSIEQPSLWAEATRVKADDSVVEPAEPPRVPYFEFRRSEDLSGPPETVTSASSPLLSRAFRALD